MSGSALKSGVFLVLLALLLNSAAFAGEPAKVAGITGFNSSVKGQPLTWAGGTVSYYTDQGGLGPVLQSADADALVADAFSRWTSIQTVALSATRGGQLAEDVSGANVTLSPDGVSLPPDIQPTATAKPIAIVYDSDGQVTDALLGVGSSTDCMDTTAYGGADAVSSDAHFTHALVILNGACVATSDRVADLRYHLVRVLGRVLGLGWSQVNVNVWSGTPVPTADDKAGFPLMHATDLSVCVPISLCLPNADQPRLDDRAALARLYPVTMQNRTQFPGKQVSATVTARIHGSVRFSSILAAPGQPMQGVNVVARWIDPTTGQLSRTYSASAVSGFLFRGNAGNPVTGVTDPTGNAYDANGSDDPAVEGFFDLAGLEFPDGRSTALYQLAVEAIDPLFSSAVEPYGRWQVTPSGSFAPILVTLNRGGDVAQDVEMTGTPAETTDRFEPETWDAPAPLPISGDWIASFSGYGDTDYYQFTGQTNRTLSVEVTALDERGQPTLNKALPVIGMWALSSPAGTVPGAFTSSPFNTSTPATTRLDAQLLTTTGFRIGAADLRGDGRPDYRYQMRVFYADKISPPRLPMNGGITTITGSGFRENTVVSSNAQILSYAPNRLLVRFPAMDLDDVESLTLTDPVTGASSVMTNALTCGAASDDRIVLASAALPAVPVGGETESPVRFQVLAADKVTAVAGATVQLQAGSGATLDACAGTALCSVLSDESGRVSTFVRVQAASTITVTAVLAPASYSPPSTAQTTVVGSSSATDIALLQARQSIAQGASLDLPLTARVLANGSPVAGKTVNFSITAGSATLSAASATTGSDGYATTTLRVHPMSNDVQVSACVAPGNNPCRSFTFTAVRNSLLQVEPVSGTAQAVLGSEVFQPFVARVTDGGSPAKPVRGASVTFSALDLRVDPATFTQSGDDTITGNFPAPVLLGSAQAAAVSDADGLASWTPPRLSAGDYSVKGLATAGSGSSVGFAIEVFARASQGTQSQPASGTQLSHTYGGSQAGTEQPRVIAGGAPATWVMNPPVEGECVREPAQPKPKAHKEVHGKRAKEEGVPDETTGNIEAETATTTPETQESTKAAEVKSAGKPVVSAELPAPHDRVCPARP
jgi:hypothetical protein